MAALFSSDILFQNNPKYINQSAHFSSQRKGNEIWIVSFKTKKVEKQKGREKLKQVIKVN